MMYVINMHYMLSVDSVLHCIHLFHIALFITCWNLQGGYTESLLSSKESLEINLSNNPNMYTSYVARNQ